MKIIFMGMLVVVLGCVFLIRQSGYNPKPILVMKASKFISYSDLGASLFKRFYLEAKDIPHYLIVCDFSDCKQEVIWQSFLSETLKNKLKARIYYSHKINAESQDVSNQDKQAIIKKINNSLASDVHSLHIIPKSMLDSIVAPKQKVIHFYMTHFYINKDQEKKESSCTEASDLTNIDCLRLGYSRRYYRKDFDPLNKHAGMEKVSSNKYIIYLN